MARVTPITLSYNTAYLLAAGGERLLVDTGPDYRGATDTLAAAMEGRGPSLVVATHGHLDHAGLGRWWQERGARVAVHEADLYLVRAPHFTLPGEFECLVSYVTASGAGAKFRADLVAGLERRRAWVERAAVDDTHLLARPTDRWPTALLYRPYEPDVEIAGPRTVVAEGVTARHCPGHTPGNLVLTLDGEGILFSGDQLLRDITPTPAVQFVSGAGGAWSRFPSLPRFLDSLRSLEAIGFERCYPGHGEPFDDVNAVIAQNIAQVEHRTARVREELQHGPASVNELGERMYPRALARRWWQIVATIQGHLDLLAERREAFEHDGQWMARS